MPVNKGPHAQMNLRPIFYVIGILLSILAISMILPMLADLYFNNEDWKVFLFCIIVTAFFGGSLILTNAGGNYEFNTRQAFMMITCSWLMIALFGALPFKMTVLNMNFTDAFFEAMSGITTTGSTVIVGLDSAPPGILLWRGILQWLGGIGIIIMAMSVMPFLNIGGMQIFRAELSESNKALPRTAQLASSIGLIYLVLTLACIVGYMLTGLSTFDAVTHALSTISTGGFSTYDSSFANFQNPWTEIVAILFMICGSLPFVLYLQAVNGDINALLKDTQVRWFLSIVGLSVCSLVIYLAMHDNMTGPDALRGATFNIVSLMSGTGFVNSDYDAWGGFATTLLFFLMAMGGCAGSTTCGIKIFRFQVFYAVAKVQFQKLLHPSGVFMAKYNGKPVSSDVPMSVMSFLFLYAIAFSLVTVALSLVGLDPITALSGALTSISNVGPGLGEVIGPSGSFKPLPDSAKWILSLSMLLGRLEILTVLVMFSPHFWKR